MTGQYSVIHNRSNELLFIGQPNIGDSLKPFTSLRPGEFPSIISIPVPNGCPATQDRFSVRADIIQGERRPEFQLIPNICRRCNLVEDCLDNAERKPAIISRRDSLRREVAKHYPEKILDALYENAGALIKSDVLAEQLETSGEAIRQHLSRYNPNCIETVKGKKGGIRIIADPLQACDTCPHNRLCCFKSLFETQQLLDI